MIKPTKTFINMAKIKFLGHHLSIDGIAPDPARVDAILSMEDPTDVPDVRSFLDATLFYRKFIPSDGDVAMPLYELTKKGW